MKQGQQQALKDDMRRQMERKTLEWDLAQEHPSWSSRRCRRAAELIMAAREGSWIAYAAKRKESR